MSDMTKRQRPVVCSLQNLEIELNDEIRRHLGAQYAQFDRKDADKDSEYSHLDLILTAMKRPPAYTTCRVNLIRTTRTEVLNELRSLLSSTPQLKVVESSDFTDVIDIIPTELDKSSLSSLTRPVEDDEENAESITSRQSLRLRAQASRSGIVLERTTARIPCTGRCDCGSSVLRRVGPTAARAPSAPNAPSGRPTSSASEPARCRCCQPWPRRWCRCWS